MKAHSILDTIGNTPHVRLQRLFGSDREVWLKLEKTNPMGSIKDRIALSMIEKAEEQGVLTPSTMIIEPTSGNTGIALAMVCAVKGYKLTLVMPESMSIERRRVMSALGATLDLTPKEKGIPGAIARAEELCESISESWMPQQFNNQANVEIHERTTAEEIISDFQSGVDYMITGVGTGGHITGCARRLRESFPELKVFAVEPEASPVLSGGEPGPHKIQGIGAGFIPENTDTSLFEGVVTVSEEEAFEYARQAARKEGIFLGISSGATLAAIAKSLPTIPKDKVILGFCYDHGERYLSVDGLFK